MSLSDGASVKVYWQNVAHEIVEARYSGKWVTSGVIRGASWSGAQLAAARDDEGQTGEAVY